MIEPQVVKIIKDHYHARAQNGDYSNNNLGFGLVHYSIIRNLRPERVLVVGSQKGYVPAICALACKDERKGHVDFVDAGYQGLETKAWGGLGIWKTATSDYWKPLGVEKYITIHNVETKDFKPQKYDYIYIDGDHSYEGVKTDYELFWKCLNPNGMMSFHDILVDKDTTEYGPCGVKKFWNEIVQKHKQYIEYNFEVGLGILQNGKMALE